MTTPFADAAALMARVLGAPDYSFVTIAHPISSASPSALAERAAAAADDVATLLLRGRT